jgi:hypothetical protein
VPIPYRHVVATGVGVALGVGVGVGAAVGLVTGGVVGDDPPHPARSPSATAKATEPGLTDVACALISPRQNE